MHHVSVTTDDVSSPHRFGLRDAAVNFTVWSLFGLLQGTSWLVAPHSPPGTYEDVAAIRTVASALSNAWQWSLLTPVVFRQAAWLNADSTRWVRRALVVLVVALLTAGILSVIAPLVHRFFVPRLPGSPLAGAGGLLGSIRGWVPQQIVTFAVVFAAGLVFDASRRYHRREREAIRLQAQTAALQAQLSDARLAALQARLNPHFLFNTLNAVSALVVSDPRRVRDMIALLSDLLRHSLSASREQQIPLREELRLLRIYLEILEIRFQGQLRTSISSEEGLEQALVPNLVLQPLVENSMKHGIERAGGRGSIDVAVRRDGERLLLTVRDSGPGANPATVQSSGGTGLGLTRARLRELYGDDHDVSLDATPDAGMIARVALPYLTDSPQGTRGHG